ncbi:YbfB/YjiJ family MFS transporter [Pseudomonas sp. NA-150]|uniref:YbfB/YjiJ family MFS transporter n=1 Tax=Pseudomonas sp. NA-150 TaxID=3367525 RepID=UPI0037CA06DF
MNASKPMPAVWRLALSGLCATLLGMGLARFAYTPLLPAVIAAHWFAASDAAYLGAANLVGYLLGALLGVPLAARFRATSVLRGAMLVATLSFFACAWPLDFAWFFSWRLLSGICGGLLMVLAAPSILPHVPVARRGLVGGVIFVGVGLGIVASGTLVPLLLRQGLMQTWIGLGVLAAIVTLVAWQSWPTADAPGAASQTKTQHAQPTKRLRLLYVQYGLYALGLVPHTIFIVDFVARGLGQGLDAGSHYWVLLGLGAVVGPLLVGHLADRSGYGPALRLAFIVGAAAVALPAVTHNTAALMVSSLIVGAFTPGIVPLVLGRIHELLEHHPSLQRGAWRSATTAFAIMQASSAYGMSWLLSRGSDNYHVVFLLGAAAMTVSLTLDLLAAVLSRRDAVTA